MVTFPDFFEPEVFPRSFRIFLVPGRLRRAMETTIVEIPVVNMAIGVRRLRGWAGHEQLIGKAATEQKKFVRLADMSSQDH